MDRQQRLNKVVMEDYCEVLGSLGKKKAIVVGDVMVDSYMIGSVERISPEAPVPVVSISDRKYRLGGAANVALNMAAFGTEVYLCSVIGNDAEGNIFRNLLHENNLPDNGIVSSENRKTTTKTRVISGGQHLIRIDDEDSSQISDEDHEYNDRTCSLSEQLCPTSHLVRTEDVPSDRNPRIWNRVGHPNSNVLWSFVYHCLNHLSAESGLGVGE